MSNPRTRTITWEDPRTLAKAAVGLSGMEYSQKIVAGELPPLGALMNFRIAELSEGRAVFTVEPAEYHYNPIGVVHSGVAATLLDSAMGCAVHSTFPAGASYTTLEIKVNYIRPMSAETGLLAVAPLPLKERLSTRRANSTPTAPPPASSSARLRNHANA